jgi:NADPH:quinone reductase-like Zn-dependent oxidoreductase
MVRLTKSCASETALPDLLDAGRLKPVPIDRAFPLAEAPAALAYLSSGTARGRSVITP